MSILTRGIRTGLCIASSVVVLTAVATAQTSTTATVKGNTTVDTTKLTAVVMYVEGNTLVARMSGGEIRTFVVPDTIKFVIDGKPVTVHDLKPGTSLRATIVTTTTPVTERTTTNLSGTVWYANGSTVILTLPDGKNKMYKSLPGYKFKVNGRDATVFDLRKGMMVSAEKVVEEPTTEVAHNTTVFGSAPRPKIIVAEQRH
jgi:hypothetical protein